jgi:WD40 repeat protein
VQKLADAVAYAHGQGVLHRDVKAANVMLDPAGEPQLLDFGLALRLADPERMTQDGAVLGTPAYLAPEVLRGRRESWTPAVDQYALGVVLYELLTGRTPFAGPLEAVIALHRTLDPERPSRLSPAVPRDLEAVCLKCLEKDPARRYADCAALADDLRRWLDGRPTAARPLGTGERLARWVRRNRALTAALASAATFLIAGVIGSTLFGLRAATQATRAEREAQLATAYLQKAREETKTSQRLASALGVERDRLTARLAQNTIFLAQSRLQQGRDADARALLDDVPLAHRHFEWFSLRRSNRPDSLQANVLNFSFGSSHSSHQLVSFCPFNRMIARGQGGVFRIGRFGADNYRFTIQDRKQQFTALAFSPSGRLLASGDTGGAIGLWDTTTGQKIHTIDGPEAVQALTFIQDERQLVCAFRDGSLSISDVFSGRSTNFALTDNAGSDVTTLAWSPKGQLLAAGGRGQGYGLAVWDLSAGQKVTWMNPLTRQNGSALLGHQSWVICLAFSNDGTKLASSSFDDTVRLWDLKAGKQLHVYYGHGLPVWSLAFSPDGHRLASGSKDKTVKIWDTESGLELLTLRGHNADVDSVSFSSDGLQLFSCSRNGEVGLWGGKKDD